MSNEIAILMNQEGITTSFNEVGRLVVYERVENGFEERKSIDVDLRNSENPRQYLKDLGQEILPCKAIACSKMIGIAYQIFERLFFDIWEIEETVNRVLEFIWADRMRGENEEGSTEQYIIEKEDKITVDLIKILSGNSVLTSKKVIKPILNRLGSKTLIIKCSHTPPWIHELEKKGSINIYTRKDGGSELITLLKVGE